MSHRWAATLVAAFFLTASVAQSATLTAGSCGTFATIQGAVNAANPGDTISVCSGTFSELVTVNKPLTVLGAQAGVDARTRVAASESIVNGNAASTGFNVVANNVVIDGFTLSGATNAANFGTALLVGAGVSGTHILNNIISNNISGITLANGSGGQALIQHNLITNNNQPGPVSGTGIYSDQFAAGGTLQNVLIDANTFSSNGNAAIEFGSSDATKPATNITISNNLFDTNADSVVLLNTTASLLTANTFQNSSSTEIAVFEGVNGVTIFSNTLNGGTGRALHTTNLGTGAPNATAVTFTGNSITGYTGPASIVQVDNYNGTLDATCNWWGTSSGPTNPSNPGGAGTSVSSGAKFLPWTAPAPPVGKCLGGATMTVFQGSPQSAVVATTFATTLQAQVLAGGNPYPGVSVTFTAPSSGASGAFAGPTTVTTDANGIATAPAFTANSIPGVYQVTAAADPVVMTTFSLTNTAGPATHFTVSAPATATAGTSFNFTVTALDQFNNTATGYAGTVHFTSTSAGVLPANSTLTNGTGTFSATLNALGNQTITATDTVTGSITGTSNTIAVSAGVATHFTVTAPATALSGIAFNITVTALDASNSIAVGYAGTVHFTSSDGGAVLPANATLTGGTGSFSATLNTAGNQTITATDTVMAAIAGTSNVIAVSLVNADLGITKTASPGPYFGSIPVTYTIVVTNHGPGTATGVAVTDVLPVGTSFVSANATQGSCSGTTTVTCSIGSMPNAASATITLILTLPSAAGSVSNTASVTSTTADTNAANDTATSTITAGPASAVPTLSWSMLVMLAMCLSAIAAMRLRG